MRTLAVIPARGGSKGLPGKNIKNFLGHPLIAWSINRALNSKLIDDVIVSTDDEDIARTALEYGADVPFMRPAEYATDESPTSEALLHLLDNVKDNKYDVMVLLEPTSPLRKENDIDKCLRKFSDQYSEIDALTSLGRVSLVHPSICKSIDQDGNIVNFMRSDSKPSRRQDLEPAYFPYGVFYGVKISSFLENHTFYQDRLGHFLIEDWQNYEIDNEVDFEVCQAVAKLKGMKIL